jgi:leader peptidase (prepilin peptidase)/N-methyltransferase
MRRSAPAALPLRKAPRPMTQIRWSDLAAALLGLAAVGVSLWAVPGTIGVLGAGLALLMAAIARIDARYLLIPNELNAAALALALVHAAALAPLALIESMVWAGVRGTLTMLLFLALRLGYRRLRGRDGLGLGDVKLAFVAGAWLDWTMIPVAVEIAAGGALLAYLAWRALGKQAIDVTTRLPFGLFLAPSIWLAWLIGALLAA